jgi:GT2 family glycosyltransferase
MSSSRPTVSVVLLSYSRPHLLREALAAAMAQTYESTEIIVVDNRSPASGEVARVVAEYPQARLIANEKNLGFTGGMNVGIHAARGRYTFLTEDDIVLDSQCVGELVQFLDRRPDVGLASGVLLKHGSSSVHCAGGHFALDGMFRMSVIGVGTTHGDDPGPPYAVGYVPGAMVFARTDFLRRLGGFRDDFFMYCDDVELCARVTRSGRAIVVVPRAVASHFEPPLGPTPAHVEFHKGKNFLALYLLHAPLRVLPEFFTRYVCFPLARDLLGSPRSFWRRLRPLCSTLARLPTLLRDRRRILSTAGAYPPPPAAMPLAEEFHADCA